MRAVAALLVLAFSSACSLGSASSEDRDRARSHQPKPADASPWKEMHGACVMHLTSWEGRFDDATFASLLTHIKAQGANTVALSAFAWQDRLDSTSLRPWDGKASGRGDLIRAIDAARRAGLRVLLKPHVEIGQGGKREAGAWRGNIRFDQAGPARAWFASYRSFLLDLAQLAREHDVEVLAVGLELGGLTLLWRDDWVELIRAVRLEYPGKLTYCANWWGEFENFKLWGELDLLGVQAFGPLSPNPQAEAVELQRGALARVATWRRMARKWRRPLLLTEFGFKSSEAPWVEPWQWEGGVVSRKDQLAAYDALLQDLDTRAGSVPSDWLAGSLVWLYEAGKTGATEGDAGFSPAGKPAEKRLRAFWSARMTPD